LPDRIFKCRPAADVDIVIEVFHPLDIGTETDRSAKIERGVNAQPRLIGHRIDQMPERRTRALDHGPDLQEPWRGGRENALSSR